MMTPNVIAIMGPTASGKTAAALALAQHLPCEIISVDSALIYRQMDIGSAKPSAAELAAVPHHLIDIIDPAEAYSVAQFQTDVMELVQQISARGNVPLLVGGTMMYFKVLMNGLGDLPPANLEIRARLDAEIAANGVQSLHARLALLDPITATRLPPGDTQRIQRALEVIELTGQPLSTLFAQQTTIEPPLNIHAFSLEPSERSVLHQRIAQRFDVMLQQGFLDEVCALRARGDLNLNMPSMRCVGYRQAWEYLDGVYDLAELRERGIIATRQLAKRQLTWLRSMPERIVLDCLQPDVIQTMLQQLERWNYRSK
ncbi:miaA: tRNA dimethylallyltransferase [Solimicrobium silvestre]|uniref:tRNA dimethylallyltransferase n=2 Tax=Solimicrobium silvestre TaxID=2099400 RepID=A0A2S9H0V5_9BURK|nr:miaA: tRNA dimethylallyltransferase [Solimicrobium silvestre]